jgi:secondary thiamine-phosphate synthase enzyme
MATPITVPTEQTQQVVDVTDQVAVAVGRSDVDDGVVLVFCPHTSCGLALNEDEIGFHDDLSSVLEEVAPRGRSWVHDDLARRTQNLTPGVPERRNGWSHVRALLATTPSLTLPVADGRLAVGRWQRILLVEFDGPRSRTLHVRTWSCSA